MREMAPTPSSSPSSHSLDRSALAFLDDDARSPTSPLQHSSTLASHPRSHAPQSTASPSTPAVLSALSALQSRVAELRLERRLLLAQIDQAAADGRAREEAAKRKADEALQRERDRLRALLDEEERGRARWSKERELWEAGLQSREAAVLDMKEKLKQWQAQFDRVKVDTAEMRRLAKQREQQAADDLRALQRLRDEERRRAADAQAQWARERADTQATVVALLRDMKGMHEHCAALERAQSAMRQCVDEAAAMREQWAELRSSRHGRLDGAVLACVQKQEGLLVRLIRGLSGEANNSGSTQRRSSAEEADDGGLLEPPPRVRPGKALNAAAKRRKAGGINGAVRSRSEKTARRSSACVEPAGVPRASSLTPRLRPRPQAASRPRSARIALPRASSLKPTVLRPLATTSAFIRPAAPETEHSEGNEERFARGQRALVHDWTARLAPESGNQRRTRDCLSDQVRRQWGIDRDELLNDYRDVLRS